MAVKMFAAVTIGSTETELKIFEFTARRVMKEIEWVSTRLNLGGDAYSMGRISRDNIEELCKVLLDFKRIMNGYKVDAYKVCATSAFRETRNMIILRDYIEKQHLYTPKYLQNQAEISFGDLQPEIFLYRVLSSPFRYWSR